jgi:hypothetical protein
VSFRENTRRGRESTRRGLWAVASAAALLCLAGCALSSHRLIGTPRPAISPDQVRVYTETPARPFQQIALVSASSRRSGSFTYEGKAEAVIQRLKVEAAKLGANGVLLEGISEESGGALGTDLGTSYEGPRGTIDLGLGVTTFLVSRYGSGIAIYVAAD